MIGWLEKYVTDNYDGVIDGILLLIPFGRFRHFAIELPDATMAQVRRNGTG